MWQTFFIHVFMYGLYLTLWAFVRKVVFLVYAFMPSVLWRCWLGGRNGIWPVKTEWWGAGMVICLEQGADLHMAQLMPLPLTVCCFSKIQIGFAFLVPAHPGSPGQRAVKRVCVCVVFLVMCLLIFVFDVHRWSFLLQLLQTMLPAETPEAHDAQGASVENVQKNRFTHIVPGL